MTQRFEYHVALNFADFEFRPQETNLLGFLASFSLVFDVRNLYI